MNFYRAAFTSRAKDFWADKEIRRKLRKIDVRTLQIFGTADKYLSVVGAEGTARYVADHRLELLAGVSHWVQQQRPNQVNKIIDDFLTSPEMHK